MTTALLCGYGWAARRLWVPGLLAAGFNEFGVYDPASPGAAAPSTARLHTLDKLEGLSADDYDVAIVASPNATHAKLALQLLDAGIPVIVEKPVCASTAELHALQMASERTGAALLRSCSPRYDSDLTRFLDLLSRQGPREPSTVRASWLRRNGIPNSPWLTRAEHALAGSCLDLGWHLLESVMAITGPAPLTLLRARFGTHTAADGRACWHGEPDATTPVPIDVDTAASLSCAAGDGTRVQLDTAWRSSVDADTVTLEVRGDGALFRLTTIFGMSTAVNRSPAIDIEMNGRTRTISLGPKSCGDAHARMVADFAANRFDAGPLRQTSGQLHALTTTAEAIIVQHDLWRRHEGDR